MFCDTYDWTKNTGEGVKEIDPMSFCDCVLKRFPYFFELEGIMSDHAGVQPLLTNEDLSDEGKLEEEKLTDEDNSNLIQEDAYFSEELDNMITIGVKRKMPLRSMDNFLSPPPPTKGKDDIASLSLALSKGNKSKPSTSKIPVLKCSRTPVVNERQRQQLMFNVKTLSQSIHETKKDKMIFKAEELKLQECEVKLQDDCNEQQFTSLENLKSE